MPQPLVFVILALPLVGAYAMYAIGIVTIYRSSRVLNLAHGALATIPAYLLYSLVVLLGVSKWVAIPLAIGCGAILGLGVERIFVRRLRSISPTAQTVGTVAAFGVMISLAAKVWGTAGIRAVVVFPEGGIPIGASDLRYGQVGLLAVAVILTAVLYLFLQRTWFGLAMRGAAQNRRAASFMGIDPDKTSGAAWGLGGALAATAGILLSAVTILHPYSLSLSVLPAFVAALIGGLERIPGALAGSVIVGITIGLVPVLADVPFLEPILGQVGGAELTLTAAAMVVMALRGRRSLEVDQDAGTTTAYGGRASNRRRPFRVPPIVLIAIAVAWVWIPGIRGSLIADGSRALIYAMVAASLLLLTGWVGQISLAQASFVGIGAFGSILITNRLGLAFPLGLPLAGAMAAAAALGLGALALRVRGLYLAVATLIFGWMADRYLFSAPWFAGIGGSATMAVEPIGVRGGYPYIDFDDRRVFYLVALAGATLVFIILSNLKNSKTGRAFLAVRGSETAAASLGIDITRYKLLAFGLSGFIAGLAGSLIATEQQTIVPSSFSLAVSLFFLSILVVGGIESVGGIVAASVLFAALNQLFLRVDALHGWLDVVSSGLLAGVLLFYPGGLGAVPATLSELLSKMSKRGEAEKTIMGVGRVLSRLIWWFRDVLDSLLESRLGRTITQVRRRRKNAHQSIPIQRPEPLLVGDEAEFSEKRQSPSGDRASDVPMLQVSGATVRYSGLTAVEGVTLEVRQGEIVGLIGPNGAGKTTLFNVIAGFVAASPGEVLLRGQDVTHHSVHERAALGIGRTFQVVQLFPQLTIFDNLLVACHLSNPTGFLSHLVVTSRSARAENESFARVEHVLRILDLEDLRDRRVAGLPFGMLRIVELGRALVTGAPLVMLDEPASGLDSAETDRLSDVLRRLRDELNLTFLLIEHDVRMVMTICDYVHVIDQGELIAGGTPDEVRSDPLVISAYLGRDAGLVASQI